MKVAALLLVTLGVMRIASWMIAWLMMRLMRRQRKGVRIGANLTALALFVAFLIYDRLPGELLDPAALVFGIVTFGVFAVIDWWWWPWRAARS